MAAILLDDFNGATGRVLVLSAVAGSKTQQQLTTEFLTAITARYSGWSPTEFDPETTDPGEIEEACESAFSVLFWKALAAYLITRSDRLTATGEVVTVWTITPP